MFLLLCASGCDTLDAPADDADTDPGVTEGRTSHGTHGDGGVAGGGSRAADAASETPAGDRDASAGATNAASGTAGSGSPTIPDMCSSTEAIRFSEECVFMLSVPLTPGSECMSRVTLDGKPVQCDDANGWSMIKPDLIRLNGRSCQAALSSSARVVVTAPCSGVLDDDDPEPPDAGPNTGEPTIIGTGPNVGPMLCGTVGVVRVDESCDFQLSQRVEPGTECTGVVTLNGQPLTCRGANGWILAEPQLIRLIGGACEAARASATALVQAQFPCGVN